MPISNQAMDQIKSIISSTKADKWISFGNSVSTILSSPDNQDRTSIVTLANNTSGIILSNLSIIKNRSNSIMADFRSLLPATSAAEKRTAFITKFNDLIANKRASGDTRFVEFSDLLIKRIILDCIDNNSWKHATAFLQEFSTPELLNCEEFKKITFDLDIAEISDAIKFMNMLSIGCLSEIAGRYPISEFEKFLPKDENTKIFLKRVAEAQPKIILAHDWSITGQSDGVNLEGSTLRLQHHELVKIIKHIQETRRDERQQNIASDISSTIIPTQILEEILTRSDKQAIDIDAEKKGVKKFDNKNFNKPPYQSLINTARVVDNPENPTYGHEIAIGFYKDKFVILERSLGEMKGIRVYKINDELRSKLLLIALHHSHESAIERQLELAGANAELLHYIPMKPQVAGNCAWVATKGAYWIAVYINALRLIEEKQLPVSNPHEEASKIATASYKYLSNQKRILDVTTYIDSTSQPKDEDLLAEIAAKTQRQSWINRGMSSLMPLFSDTTKNKAKLVILRDLIAAIQTADLKKVAQLAPLAATNNTSIQNAGLFKKAINVVASNINLETEQFKPFLEMLKLLVNNNITNVDLENNYLCPQHYFEALLEQADNINQNNRSAVFAAMNDAIVPTNETLIYMIMDANPTQVSKLLDILPEPDTISAITEQHPIEIAVRRALLSADDNDEEQIFQNTIAVLKQLIAKNVVTHNAEVLRLLKSPSTSANPTIAAQRRGQILSIWEKMEQSPKATQRATQKPT